MDEPKEMPVLKTLSSVEFSAMEFPSPFKMGERFTEGPWAVEKQRRGDSGTNIGEPIAVVGGEATDENVEFIIGRTCDFGPHGDVMTQANAFLIRCAPEMYEALSTAQSFLNPLSGFVKKGDAKRQKALEAFREKLRSLLKKAREGDRCLTTYR